MRCELRPWSTMLPKGLGRGRPLAQAQIGQVQARVHAQLIAARAVQRGFVELERVGVALVVVGIDGVGDGGGGDDAVDVHRVDAVARLGALAGAHIARSGVVGDQRRCVLVEGQRCRIDTVGQRKGHALADDLAGAQVGQGQADPVGLALAFGLALRVDAAEGADQDQRAAGHVGGVEGLDLEARIALFDQLDQHRAHRARGLGLLAGDAVDQRVHHDVEAAVGRQLGIGQQGVGGAEHGLLRRAGWVAAWAGPAAWAGGPGLRRAGRQVPPPVPGRARPAAGRRACCRLPAPAQDQGWQPQ
jgi:hypothetical protein